MFLRRKYSKSVRDKLGFLLESQNWNTDQINAYQWDKVKSLVKFAWENSSYYNNILKTTKIKDGTLKSWEEFKDLPFLTKEIIQTNLDNIKTNNKSEYIKNTTGGSTGNPLSFYQCTNYLDWAESARIRSWKYFPGGKIDSIEGLLWGAERDIGKNLPLSKVLYHLVREGTLPLNSFDMNEDIIKRYVFYFNIIKPVILRGYASSLMHFSEYILKNEVPIYSPKAIVSSAELLTKQMRDTITKALGAPIYDSYGCREVSQIATECEAHNGLHIIVENNYVELIDGSVVVTNLNNYIFPFIRYHIGDIGTSIENTKCSCGRQTPRLLGLRGRESEVIKFTNGKSIHGEYFTHLFYTVDHISAFQAVYHKLSDKLEIRICLKDGAKFDGEQLVNKVKNEIGHSNIEIVPVKTINKTATGKYKFVYIEEN